LLCQQFQLLTDRSNDNQKLLSEYEFFGFASFFLKNRAALAQFLTTKELSGVQHTHHYLHK
jgi:hypothetical protein